MKRFMIVGAFALLAGEQALAADLPPPAPMPRAPAVYVPAPIPVYNWTGFYIGGNLGVGWQQGNLGDTLGNTFGTDNSIKGLGGGQVGVNYEFATASWSVPRRCSTGGLTPITPCDTTLVSSGRHYRRHCVHNGQQSMADHGDRQTRLRLGSGDGLRQGRWRLGGIEQSDDCSRWRGVRPFRSSTSNWGWTVGAGAEYAFYGGWSARIEYDYVGLTNQTFTVPAGGRRYFAGDQFTFNNRNIQMVTAGINYKFGGWGW